MEFWNDAQFWISMAVAIVVGLVLRRIFAPLLEEVYREDGDDEVVETRLNSPGRDAEP